MKLILNFIFVLLVSTVAMAQGPTSGKADLPKVILLGEHVEAYEAMSKSFSSTLFAECDGDMQVGYEKWMGMLKEMEAYSKELNYDMNGIVVWLNVFWNPDGSIKHIAYHLKPESRNVNTGELSAFFKTFAKNYKLPLVSTKKYAHYGFAFFPTAPKRVANK